MNNKNQYQPRAVFSMMTVRCIIMNVAATVGNFTARLLLPTEILNDDGYLGENKSEIIGAEIVMHHRQRNARMKAEPRGGKRFLPIFNRRNEGDGNEKFPGVAEEVMCFLRIDHPDGTIQDNGQPLPVTDRTQVMAWVSIDAYASCVAQCEVFNAKIPELEKEIGQEERTLWRFESEALGFKSEWMTPDKLKEGLQRSNASMIPSDAKWFKRDPDIGIIIAKAVKEDPTQIKKLVLEGNRGIECPNRPAKLLMMKTGLCEQLTRQPQSKFKGGHMDDEQKAIMDGLNRENREGLGIIPFPSPADGSKNGGPESTSNSENSFSKKGGKGGRQSGNRSKRKHGPRPTKDIDPNEETAEAHGAAIG